MQKVTFVFTTNRKQLIANEQNKKSVGDTMHVIFSFTKAENGSVKCSEKSEKLTGVPE